MLRPYVCERAEFSAPTPRNAPQAWHADVVMDDKATRVSLSGCLCRPRPRRAKKLRGGVFGFESRRACGVQRHRVVPRRQADASTSEDPGKIGNGVQRGEAGQPPIAEQSNFRVGSPYDRKTAVAKPRCMRVCAVGCARAKCAQVAFVVNSGCGDASERLRSLEKNASNAASRYFTHGGAVKPTAHRSSTPFPPCSSLLTRLVGC